jgi:hypothetical protein
MPADDWQRALRRQFGREQGFELQNLGDSKLAPVFSDFRVINADSGGHYRVAIRGTASGDNLCTCPDFATNDLGTCKHIEFTLAKLAARRGGKAALARGLTPPYSEVFLHHGGQRSLRFRPGADCPPALLARARELFDEASGWVLPWARIGELDAFIASARKTYDFAYEAAISGDCSLVICDEINNAVHDGLLTKKDLEKLINDKKSGKNK